MNTYKITFTNTETGAQKSDNFTDPTEREARKSFKEVYRHATYTIDSVELIADDALASKKHERDALETIKKIVEGLGPDSYLATAFTGCFQDAEENIENDFAMSMSGRWQYAEEKLEAKKAELAQQAKNHEDDARRFAGQKKAEIDDLKCELDVVKSDNDSLKAEIEALREELAAAKTQAETTTATEITDELLDDLAAFTDIYVDGVRTAVVKNVTRIANDATLVSLLHEYATRKQQELDNYRRDLKDATKYGTEFRPSNNCLTHSSSYRDVIYDTLRPYWEVKA